MKSGGLKRFLVAAGCVAVMLAGVSVAVSATDKKKDDDLFKQVELFSDALSYIQSDYVDEVKPKDLIYGALDGMLSALDPHSQFLTPDEYTELKTDTEGKFGGIGIEIALKDNVLTVVTPIEDTPAWKAGVKPNDRIVKINNELTRGITLSAAVKKLRGTPGEAVVLTVLRDSEKKLLDFKIVRAVIKIADIKEPRMLTDGIAYLRLVEFRENTDTALSAALDTLEKQGMKALVLDLRNNPGGLLESAVNVAGEFIQTGEKVVYTRGRKKNQDVDYFSKEKKPLLAIPMVVLINEGSASGSEIVAGCLQDYKRAVIVGTTSFGKGSVQTVIPMSDGSGLRLTTSKYFTPSGRVIHGKGVTPDIVVEDTRDTLHATNGKGSGKDVKEDVGGKKADEIFDQLEEEKGAVEKKSPAGSDYTKDPQLVRSVDVLKGILISRQQK